MAPLSANAKSQQSLNKSQLVGSYISKPNVQLKTSLNKSQLARSCISKPSVQLKTSLNKSELVVARSAERWNSTTVSEAQYVLIVS
jgi:hypothetical protein